MCVQIDDVTCQNGKTGRNFGTGVHNLHSHMLLYCGVYDSTRTLYALRTLRNELLTNTRMFLCCAATTSVTNTTKNTALLNLLARHRKSVFGRNFHGDIANTEFIAAYRSSMYLEVLISVCLYFARSYYPNLGQMRLTNEEISGNRQVVARNIFHILNLLHVCKILLFCLTGATCERRTINAYILRTNSYRSRFRERFQLLYSRSAYQV